MDSKVEIMTNVVNVLGLNGATNYKAVAQMRRDTLEHKLRANQNKLHKWSTASIYGIWLTFHVVGHSKDRDGDITAFASYMNNLGFEWPAIKMLWADCKQLVVDGQVQGAEAAADTDNIARMDQAAERIRVVLELMPKPGSALSSTPSRAPSMSSSIVSSGNRSIQPGPLQFSRYVSYPTGGAFVPVNRAPQLLPAQAGNAPSGSQNPGLPPIGGPYGPIRIPAHGSTSIGQASKAGSEAQLKAAAAESAQKSIRESQKPDVCDGCGNKGHHVINCPLGRGGSGAASGQHAPFINPSSNNFGWGRMPSQTSGGFQNTEPRSGGLTPQVENMNLHHHVEENRQAGYSPYATGAQSKNTAGGVPAGYNTFAQVAQQTANGGGASVSQNTQNTQKAPVAYMTAEEFLDDLGKEMMRDYGGVLPPQKGTPEYQSAKRTKVTDTAPGDTTKVGESYSTVMPKKSEDIVLGQTLKSLDRDPPYSDAVHDMFKNKKNVWVHHSKRPTALDLWHKKGDTEETPVTSTVPGETSGQAGNANDGDGQSEGSASMEDSPRANSFDYTK